MVMDTGNQQSLKIQSYLIPKKLAMILPGQSVRSSSECGDGRQYTDMAVWGSNDRKIIWELVYAH